MIRIEGIAAFVATVEHGSISGAARQLRLSKSVVSERLAELERSLGSALLHRTTRKLSLTEDGTAFLPRAQRIVRDVTEAAADIAERRGTLAGPLRIAAPVTFGHMHLGPALYPFLKAHPEIQLALDLDDRRIDVASSGHDAIIRQGVIDDTRLIVWKLAKSRRILTASAAYLAEHGMPQSLEDLRDHRGIFYTNRGVADYQEVTFEIGPFTEAVGDFDGNGVTDGRDLLWWQRDAGRTLDLVADANGDGRVDAADLAIWRSNFGGVSSAEASQGVPEPGVPLLLAAIFPWAASWRRA